MYDILAQAAPPPSPDWVTTLGVPAVVVLLILQMVFKFMEKWKEKKNGGMQEAGTGLHQPIATLTPQQVSDIFSGLADIKTLVNDLHQWHDARDEDHVFIWYVKKSLATGIADLNKNIGALATGVERMNAFLKRLSTEEDDG
jgi:hypothetical protein